MHPLLQRGWRSARLAERVAARFPRLAARHHLRRARRAAGRHVGAIAVARAALLEFGRASDLEFTQLAEGLGGLDTQLAEIKTQAARLDGILQDHDDDRALSSAFELYKKSVDLAHASIGIALSQEEQMEQMEGRLLHNRDEFAQHSLVFRVLVMNIRTEAARIDPENRAIFTSVAAEIDAMALQMNTTVEAAFSQIEAIVNEAARGRDQLQRLESDLHERAQGSVKLLRNELDVIRQNLLPCARISREISTLVATTRTLTGDLITSLQYQDIVRQQLEHVSQGFEDIAAHLAPSAGGRSALDPGYLHQATRVQQTHLQTSREAITQAGRKIDTGSQALLATGVDLVAHFAELEKSADRAFRESRVSELFKQETENLVRVADQSEATNLRVARLLERIEESVRLFSTDIHRHELDVQLVALNSQIAAARIPEAGALNKLAEETAHLAGTTATLTRAMNAQLDDTLGRLKTIRDESEEVRRTVGREKADLAAGAVVVSDKLGRLNDRIQASSTQVARHFQLAYQRVQNVLEKLRFQTLIAPAYAPAEELCGHLLAATAPFATAELGADGSARLATHRARYTMREEREAHAQATAPASSAATPGAAVALAAVAAAPAFVESVELFDDPPAGNTPAPATPTTAPAPPPAGPSGSASTPHSELGDGVELF